MAIQIEAPFDMFNGLDGKPLTNGKVYIGQVGTDPAVVANQIPVFWDEAMTIPAAQPLTTNAGYIVRSGAPSRVYANSRYSISVKNASNVLVYYVDETGQVDLSIYAKLSDLAASAGSALIGYIQLGAGAVYRTVLERLRDFYNVRDYGADPTGSANSVDAFNAAILACYNRGGGVVRATGIFKISGVTSIYVPSNITLDLRGATLNGDGLGTNTLIKSGWVDGGILKDLTLEYGTGTTGSGFNFAGEAHIRGGTLSNASVGILVHRFNFGSSIRDVWFSNTLNKSWQSEQSWNLQVTGCTVYAPAIMRDFVDWTVVEGNSFEGVSSTMSSNVALTITTGGYGGSYSLAIRDNGFHHFETAVSISCESRNMVIQSNHFEDCKYHVVGINLSQSNMDITQNWMKANLEVPGTCIAMSFQNVVNSKLTPNFFTTDGVSTFDAHIIASTSDCVGNLVELPYAVNSNSDLTKYQLNEGNMSVQLGGSNNPLLAQPIIELLSGPGAFTFEAYKHRYNLLANSIPHCVVDYTGTTVTIDTWIPVDAFGLKCRVAYNFVVNGATTYVMAGDLIGFMHLNRLSFDRITPATPGPVLTASLAGAVLRLTIPGVPAGGNITGWVKQL